MSWIANITNTVRNGRELTTTVRFVNGDNQFEEVFTTSEAQPAGWLDTQIKIRLRQMEQLDTYEQSVKGAIAKPQDYQVDAQTGELMKSDSKVQPTTESEMIS